MISNKNNVLDVENFKQIFSHVKYETTKYQIIARYMEKICGQSNIEKIKELEDDIKYGSYIKYIGGIGHSRALEFCIFEDCKEDLAIETINHIKGRLKENNKRIPLHTINNMLNIAVLYEKEEIIDYLLNDKDFKKKIDFSFSHYMIIKNMTLPTDMSERKILKHLLMKKIIPLDNKTRNLIKDSQDERLNEMIFKLELKEKIENKLNYKETDIFKETSNSKINKLKI